MRIIGTAARKAAVISFTVDGIHPHDLGTVLDHQGVAIRTGHHCAMPVMEFFGVPGTARASLAFYNTERDIDQLVAGIGVATQDAAPMTTHDDLSRLYRETVLSHSRSPRNFRRIESATRKATGHNPLCGDKVTVYLDLDADDRIRDIAFEATGCAISMASASMLTELVKNRSLGETQGLITAACASRSATILAVRLRRANSRHSPACAPILPGCGARPCPGAHWNRRCGATASGVSTESIR